MIPYAAKSKKNGRARVVEIVAWTAAVFCFAVATGMLLGHINTPTLDPLKSPELRELKGKLRENPADEATKARIRTLDLQLRQQYFRLLGQRSSGAYLLAGGVAVFLAASYRVRAMHKKLPMPGVKKTKEKSTAETVRSRWAVLAAGAATAMFLVCATFGIITALPGNSADVEKVLSPKGDTDAAQPDCATGPEMRANWPRFRGPDGNAVAADTKVPSSWDVEKGDGLMWKTAVLAAGYNSPLIWSNKVFYSGGGANLREIFCHDLATGQLLWRRGITNVPGSPPQIPEVPESTGFCAATMATDGRRIYAIFANGDLAAVTLDGKSVWSKGFGALKNPYGHATSLATWNDRVILQLDQGEPEDRKSKLYLLDGKTGQAIWQKERNVGSSWATPIVIDAPAKTQIVTLAIPAVISYSAADGSELWRADLLNGEITPSPVFAGGQVVVASPSDKLVSIKPDGSGDITKTHAAWTNEDNVPDITSPVSNGDLVFTISSSGMMTCLDAKSGKKLWEHDFEVECHASPVICGNLVYIIGQKGAAAVVEASREFKQVSRTQIPDAFSSSPAFAHGKIIFKGSTNLWCIGRK